MKYSSAGRLWTSWVALVLMAFSVNGNTQSAPLKPFTVATEIGLTGFDRWGSEESPIVVSPNGRFVAVWSERGELHEDLVQDELRIYDVGELKRFVLDPRRVRVPAPILVRREATYNKGPIISAVSWLRDSSGLVFLLRGAQGRHELATITLKGGRLRVLSLSGQNVTEFDMRSATHYVYAVSYLNNVLPKPWIRGRPVWDATGRSLDNIVLRKDMEVEFDADPSGRSVLWAAVGGGPHLVLHGGAPILFYPSNLQHRLALSPNGQMLATALPVASIPRWWVHAFPPGTPGPYNFLRAGQQNLDVPWGIFVVKEYALVNLDTGAITAVNGTPAGGRSIGWLGQGAIAWSDDGQAVLLPDAFVKPAQAGGVAGPPCVAVFDVAKWKVQCLEGLKPFDMNRGLPPGYFSVQSLRFGGHGGDRVIMRYILRGKDFLSAGSGTKAFVRGANGTWRVAREEAAVGFRGNEAHKQDVDVQVEQSYTQPPVVVAKDPRSGRARVIWNPNPQLKGVALGDVSLYYWKDADGREWTGGLYKPINYVAGRRYPLVIQTHGFFKQSFRPSGVYPTAFAARELAGSGMFVLQAPLCPFLQNPRSGPCEVEMYEAAVRQLTGEGVVNPDKIGIIGFSYTVYTVLYALTNSEVHFEAASVTDGWNYGYLNYLASVDSFQDADERVSESTVGAKPFGSGLQLWLKRAPDFNMQRVETPLMVTDMNRLNILSMWEPYSILRYLHKPVDMILLNDEPYEHVLTNPELRLASQGGAVDWFRFWLQGYESPDPTKANEYRRWEKLCEMQSKVDHRTSCVSTPGEARTHGKR